MKKLKNGTRETKIKKKKQEEKRIVVHSRNGNFG